MSATTSHLPLRAAPFRAPTVRLALRPESPARGHSDLDGAWWPRSRDLASLSCPPWRTCSIRCGVASPGSRSTPATGRASRLGSPSTDMW
ncbi:DUF5994 family protein [Streptomyces sp. FB2]|uniref:DUF5994 family protein n=1 Tax=Streptomyces sp. FB2 TaxID=2902454 RepID=UPI0035AC0656